MKAVFSFDGWCICTCQYPAARSKLEKNLDFPSWSKRLSIWGIESTSGLVTAWGFLKSIQKRKDPFFLTRTTRLAHGLDDGLITPCCSIWFNCLAVSSWTAKGVQCASWYLGNELPVSICIWNRSVSPLSPSVSANASCFDNSNCNNWSFLAMSLVTSFPWKETDLTSTNTLQCYIYMKMLSIHNDIHVAYSGKKVEGGGEIGSVV